MVKAYLCYWSWENGSKIEYLQMVWQVVLNEILLCRYIQGTSAHSGCGLYEGLDWLSKNISLKAESFSYSHIPHLFSHRNHQNEIDVTLIELEKEIVIFWKSGMNFSQVAILEDAELLFIERTPLQIDIIHGLHLCIYKLTGFFFFISININLELHHDTSYIPSGEKGSMVLWEIIYFTMAIYICQDFPPFMAIDCFRLVKKSSSHATETIRKQRNDIKKLKLTSVRK